MNIIFAAYRDWAVDVFPSVQGHKNVRWTTRVKNNEELYDLLNSKEKFDLVIFCGWSTPPDEWATKKVPMISEHPATSDRYSPGTPLQNQILDGKTSTKHRIVKVGYPELAPRLWSHEVQMSLEGNMDDILFQMKVTSEVLFQRFLDDYPNVTWQQWDEVAECDKLKRRTPDMSEINKKDFATLPTSKIYDMIRCLEDPYPNAFIEDEDGILYFNKVKYKSKK